MGWLQRMRGFVYNSERVSLRRSSSLAARESSEQPLRTSAGLPTDQLDQWFSHSHWLGKVVGDSDEQSGMRATVIASGKQSSVLKGE